MSGHPTSGDMQSGAPEPPGASPVRALDRARAVVRRIAGVVLRLAVAALVAAALIWWAILAGDEDTSTLVVTAVILLLPPAVLLLFVVALRTLAAVPERLRQAPAAVRERMVTIRERLREVGEPRGWVGRLRSILRLLWAIASSREVVEVVGPAAVLLTPWMLVAGIAAAGFALLELLAGIIALISLALT